VTSRNYNLLTTLRQNPAVGSGIGHMYLEIVHAFDISTSSKPIRTCHNNSILWFWGRGRRRGLHVVFGLFLSVGVFLAARVCRFGGGQLQRIMA